MERRKIQSKRRYILAFIIGTLIFIIGFMLTYSISYLEYQRISNMQGEVSYKIFQNKLRYSFFDEDICSLDSLSEISASLGFQGRVIDDLEKKLGKNDEKVLFRKKFYTLIELEHFEFVKEINKKCRAGIPTILFFYSNEKEDAERSEEAGNLLSVVYRRNPDLMIYSFDINLDSELITSLKEKYRIEESPTIIIDGRLKIVNPENIEKVERYL
jgi:hypothetical protein